MFKTKAVIHVNNSSRKVTYHLCLILTKHQFSRQLLVNPSPQYTLQESPSSGSPAVQCMRREYDEADSRSSQLWERPNVPLPTVTYAPTTANAAGPAHQASHFSIVISLLAVKYGYQLHGAVKYKIPYSRTIKYYRLI